MFSFFIGNFTQTAQLVSQKELYFQKNLDFLESFAQEMKVQYYKAFQVSEENKLKMKQIIIKNLSKNEFIWLNQTEILLNFP